MKKIMLAPVVVAVAFAVNSPAYSKVNVYEDGERKVAIGGRAHLQYQQRDPDVGESTDDIGFRRLRVELDADFSKKWGTQIEWEFGEGDELDINSGESNGELIDGYIEYRLDNGGKIRYGHTRVVQFGRSDLTSSNVHQQVERTLAGSTNSGNPARQTGVGYYSKRAKDTTFVWDLGVAFAEIDPANNQIDFDSEVTSEDENSEGILFGGRLQYFPQGYFKPAHDNFSRKSQWGFALAAFNWSNDGDQEGLDPSAPDLDNVTGMELSGAYRGYGFSIDAQYNSFSGEAVDGDLGKIGGATIFEANGDVDLDVYAIDAGYQIIPEKLQLALAYAVQDAEPYQDDFTQTSLGATYYVSRHNVKFQATYRMEENVDGVTDNDRDFFFIQAQFLY